MVLDTLPLDLALLSIALGIYYVNETGIAMKTVARDLFVWMCFLSTWAAWTVTSQAWILTLAGGLMFFALAFSILDYIIPVFKFIAAVLGKRTFKPGAKG